MVLMTPLWSHYFGFTAKFNSQIRFCSWLPQCMAGTAQPELLKTTEVQM